ncbi:Leucine-rich repeat receptor-like protein kinase PXL2 [Platanthera zijinensis]|uniref:Leucine-rich repeat receptor-like protein kinase PXL2 n=1 Tax=Platanthera zijinensis TaxID=2320716 RepID=A0AAP0BUH4_9ASPA
MISHIFSHSHCSELAYSLKLSKKSDVYSFGIVLLELLTGRSPIEPEYGEGKDIVYWVSSHLNSQNISHVLDPQISKIVEEDMIRVLKVAVLCTTKLPSVRPTMREVVNMLVDADPSAITHGAKNYVKKSLP